MSAAREKAFERWLAGYEKTHGKPTDSTRIHLHTAYCSGFIEGAAQFGDAVKPALQTNIELQRLGLKAHDTMKTTTAKLADLMGTSVDEIRRGKQSGS